MDGGDVHGLYDVPLALGRLAAAVAWAAGLCPAGGRVIQNETRATTEMR